MWLGLAEFGFDLHRSSIDIISEVIINSFKTVRTYI